MRRLANRTGWSLIELFIGLVVVLIGGMFILAMANSDYSGSYGSGSLSVGYNGVVETRCIDGYKFVISDSGYGHRAGSSITQVRDENGNSVRCD